jgi:plastocyanin
MSYARAQIVMQTPATVFPKDAHYLVYVLSRGEANALKIRPGSLTVEKGDQVTWINLADTEMQVVFFKGDLVFERFPDQSSGYSFVLEPGGCRSFVVKNEPLPREYSYQVCEFGKNKFAEANSDPRIIVL